jgi:hypothetical protein
VKFNSPQGLAFPIMSNRALRIVASISTVLLLLLVGLNLWGLSMDDETPPMQIYSVAIDCPPGTTAFTSPGTVDDEIGWYRTCVRNHGPFYFWNDGKLVVQGSFVEGKRDGTFTAYDAHGRVMSTKRYVNGQEVPSE